jgi:hypothetical protein
MPDHPVIVVGLDGSERDGDVLALAGLLARATDAALELTTVLPFRRGRGSPLTNLLLRPAG